MSPHSLRHPLISGVEIKVVPAHRVLKFRVSESLPLTDEYRKNIDDWCANFFGCSLVEVVKDNEVLMSAGVCFVNKKAFNALKKLIYEA